MILNKRKALEICLDLWAWLRDNPGKSKNDWPDWEKNGGPIPLMEYNCPCCQYVADSFREKNECMDCSDRSDGIIGFKSHIAKCPLKRLWPNGCQFKGSPFEKWDTNRHDSKAANKIVLACKRELKKL